LCTCGIFSKAFEYQTNADRSVFGSPQWASASAARVRKNSCPASDCPRFLRIFSGGSADERLTNHARRPHCPSVSSAGARPRSVSEYSTCGGIALRSRRATRPCSFSSPSVRESISAEILPTCRCSSLKRVLSFSVRIYRMCIVHLPDSTSNAYFTGQSFLLKPLSSTVRITIIQYLLLFSFRLNIVQTEQNVNAPQSRPCFCGTPEEAMREKRGPPGQGADFCSCGRR